MSLLIKTNLMSNTIFKEKAIAYDAPHMPFSLPTGNIYNSPNMVKGSVVEELSENQPPLGSQFKSYQLNQATNYYTLDPFQYSITKFDYQFPDGRSVDTSNNQENSIIYPKDFKNDPGLVYRGVNFEKLLPSFTQTKKSVNDFPAQSYHRFLANNGYFNPQESIDNSDLWYYGADNNARMSDIGVAGAALNVQEVNHIIFPEAQRGGTDSRNLTKYSWSNFTQIPNGSWESEIINPVNNNSNCEFFNYNSRYSNPEESFNKVYSFDSNYCRDIGISPIYTGSMPFNPNKVM